MSNARDNILGRIRRGLGRGELDAAARERLATRMAEPPEYLQARFEGDGLEHYLQKLSSPALTASAERLGHFNELPTAVAGYLGRNELASKLCLAQSPPLTNLDWGDVAAHHDIDRNETVAMTLAEAGIMETGSLVFLSSPESPTLYNYLPIHHLAVLEEQNLLPYMEDFWQRFKASGRPYPRNINFITGSSGTADIEAQLVRGAHGPRYLHIFLIGGH